MEMSTSSDGGEPAKPFTNRSVSLLSPEQLKRKRAQDRESQRQTRQRVKRTITELETKVRNLTLELEATKHVNLQSRPDTNTSWQRTGNGESPSERHNNFFETLKLPMDIVLNSQSYPTRYQNIVTHVMSDPFFLESEISTENPAGIDLLDPNLIAHADFPFNELQPPSLCIQVWEARPLHLPPTCRLDKIFLDIIEQRRLFGPLEGNVLEFSNASFPSVSALLNPDHHTSTLPLTTAIVTHVIYVLTVSTLPEQIAIMYVMCTMMRWQITGNKDDYETLPEWLRPGAAQLVTGHPAWVDVFPWPKAREAICQNFEYHNNWEYFKTISNQTISINWPYDPSDTLIAISDTEYIINPVFMTHIRTLENWTLGPAFVEAFPDLAKHVKVGRSRDQTRFCR